MAIIFETSPDLPPAADILNRYASITGNHTMSPLSYEDDHLELGYALDGSVTEAYDVLCGSLAVNGAHQGGYLGVYDPAQEHWRYDPDCIPTPQAHAAFSHRIKASWLRGVEERQALVREAKGPVIDVFHPLTAVIRRNLANLMDGLSVPDLVMRPNSDAGPVATLGNGTTLPREGVVFDEGTLCFPIMSRARTKPVMVPGLVDSPYSFGLPMTVPSRLGLSIIGLRVADAEHPTRAVRRVAFMNLATRSFIDPDGWTPDPGITAEQWGDVLRKIPQIMRGGQTMDENFRPNFAAMGYNVPSSLS